MMFPEVWRCSLSSRPRTACLILALAAWIAPFRPRADSCPNPTLSTHHAFGLAGPVGQLATYVMEASNGKLYGVTQEDGRGSLFSVNKDGSQFSTLHQFNVAPNDNGQPEHLFDGADGWIYGRTSQITFRIRPDGTDYAILHTALAATVLVPGGKLYGSAGANVVQLERDGSAASTIYIANPVDEQLQTLNIDFLGSDGNLYGRMGTLHLVGPGSDGTIHRIFRIDTSGGNDAVVVERFFPSGGSPAELFDRLVEVPGGPIFGRLIVNTTPLEFRVFRIGLDGSDFTSFGTTLFPSVVGISAASDGRIYGTTFDSALGGPSSIFTINTNGGDYHLLHAAQSFGLDAYAYSPLLFEGTDGVLYGTSQLGGEGEDGTVFAINKDGSGYRIIVHFEFHFHDGANPLGRVMAASDGYFYGVTSRGGAFDVGRLFRINADGTGYKPLLNFDPLRSSHPQFSDATLLEASDGRLYGTAADGGFDGAGVIFGIDKDGSDYVAVHEFLFDDVDGVTPSGHLIEGLDGKLYGTTQEGGGPLFSGLGTLFRTDKDGSNYEQIHAFLFGVPGEGLVPMAGLVQDATGALFGTTLLGGSGGDGTVFRLNPDGTDYEVIHHFTGSSTDGGQPLAALTLGSDGRLYGTTDAGGTADLGTVFRIDTNGANFTLLHSFTGNPTDGARPDAVLTDSTDGFLIGTTSLGGTDNVGTLFRIRPDGTDYCSFHSFALLGSPGREPHGGVTRGSDGVYRAMTAAGGAGDAGALFSFEVFAPPVAGPDTMSRRSLQGTKLRLSNVLLNDSGTGISLVSAGPSTTEGGTVVIVDGYVYYSPPPSDPLLDTFTYTIQSADGQTADGTITVDRTGPDSLPTSNILDVQVTGASPPYTVAITFAGIPGRTYTVESSNSPGPPWTTLGTATVGADGTSTFTDSTANSAALFYRVVFP